MKIAIHQPNFIPWLGYYKKIKEADLFILYDTAEYSKNSYINRNKMIINGEERWLTIPIVYRGSSRAAINNIEIHSINYKPEKIIRGLNQEFKRYSKYNIYGPSFDQILLEATNNKKLVDLNEKIIRWTCKILGIKTPMIRASSLLNYSLDSTDYLIEMCKLNQGKTYISGKSGRNYLKEERFREEGIKLVYLENEPIVKRYGYLSSLFWIFMKGKDIDLD